MTPLDAILFVAVVAIAVIVGQFLLDRRTIRKWGEAAYGHGYRDGWDDATSPAYLGRHQGISQPEDWTADDLAEFEPAQPLTPPYAPDPLPKRKPAVIEMAETMRPLFEELYGKETPGTTQNRQGSTDGQA